MQNFAPYLEIYINGDLNRPVIYIVGKKPDCAVREYSQTFDAEIIAEPCDDNIVVLGFAHLINDQKLAAEDQRFHRIADHADIKGRKLMLDQIAVEINSAFDIVFGR